MDNVRYLVFQTKTTLQKLNLFPSSGENVGFHSQLGLSGRYYLSQKLISLAFSCIFTSSKYNVFSIGSHAS